MKHLKKLKILAVGIITVISFSSCRPSAVSVGVHYSNPPWAPAYVSGVRYYYLPDIEVYYDLSDQSFVYLDNGQWIFSHTLPPMYSTYDLYNGFVVALNFNVYQPWIHHQVYVSHYPRFYYRNVYRNDAIKNIRGFNENERKPFYWKPEDRNSPEDRKIPEVRNRTDDRTMPIDRRRVQDKNRPEDRNMPNDQKNIPVPQRKFDAPRQPQNPIYKGREVGRPVKVRPDMRENKREENKINKADKRTNQNNRPPHNDLP